MDIDAAIRGRRSVRAYTSQPVAPETIHRLIERAVDAPSAVNEQPWTFTVVRDAALLDNISNAAKQHLSATMVAGPQADHFSALLNDPAFHIFYRAPVLILISARAQGPWAIEDCALAAGNLMLSAYSEGLGSCWIGFAQSFLNTPEGKALLSIPAEWLPVAPIIVGHPRSSSPPVERRTPVIHWVG
jgi:nitroreductase